MKNRKTRFHQLKARIMHIEKDFKSVQKAIESMASDDKFKTQQRHKERVEFEDRYYDDCITHCKESKRGRKERGTRKKKPMQSTAVMMQYTKIDLFNHT